MAHSGNGTEWSESTPAGSEPVYKGALEIRDLRKAVRIRNDKEHTNCAASSAGGEHAAGSAMAYVLATASAPTQRPDAATSFTAADVGRLWYDITTNALKVLTAAAPTWETVGIPSGAIMYFYLDDADDLPGWTIYNTVVDCLLGLKGGSQAYNVTGGDAAEKGTWSQTGHTHGDGSYTVASHVHQVTVTGYGTAGVPAGPGTSYTSGKLIVGSGNTETTETLESILEAGSSVVNVSGVASTVDGGTSASSSEASTWRPLAAVGILATKD